MPAVEDRVGWGWHVGLCLRSLDTSCLLLLALDTEDTCLPRWSLGQDCCTDGRAVRGLSKGRHSLSAL